MVKSACFKIRTDRSRSQHPHSKPSFPRMPGTLASSRGPRFAFGGMQSVKMQTTAQTSSVILLDILSLHSIELKLATWDPATCERGVVYQGGRCWCLHLSSSGAASQEGEEAAASLTIGSVPHLTVTGLSVTRCSLTLASDRVQQQSCHSGTWTHGGTTLSVRAVLVERPGGRLREQ